MDSFIKISGFNASDSIPKLNQPYYFIVLVDGGASLSVDFNNYDIHGKHILFLSPYQLLKWESGNLKRIRFLRFHGDFYCIEYHKAEVSCNGILFNNIYDKPFIAINNDFFDEIMGLFDKIEAFGDAILNYDLSIVRSYLQLILALCSKEKQIENTHVEIAIEKPDILNFKSMLDTDFASSKSVSFYADQYGLSVNAFSKKVKKHYGKVPSKLIRERLILEAKRLLHLTYKSIKEISAELGFEDEFYFSRYFKKEVGVSPRIFRDEVGISVVAKKSM
ncbi:helix-turn-helix transcriptional regulator [Sphingobacterium phlebotomi]|uniref:Helix-turn-helix transcriptional regulator n=1 Tax=Sphingobacterium phlebotomi TaxID=2605433 RepID=A0A5D4H024_9SPHI|nr:response regulator transcription factor [Sphingobacterium phlebotomi]TYR33652.1 helix-turn-helix transcriptional regulator [Sphingobacterium phlebotomi]